MMDEELITKNPVFFELIVCYNKLLEDIMKNNILLYIREKDRKIKRDNDLLVEDIDSYFSCILAAYFMREKKLSIKEVLSTLLVSIIDDNTDDLKDYYEGFYNNLENYVNAAKNDKLYHYLNNKDLDISDKINIYSSLESYFNLSRIKIKDLVREPYDKTIFDTFEKAFFNQLDHIDILNDDFLSLYVETFDKYLCTKFVDENLFIQIAQAESLNDLTKLLSKDETKYILYSIIANIINYNEEKGFSNIKYVCNKMNIGVIEYFKMTNHLIKHLDEIEEERVERILK